MAEQDTIGRKIERYEILEEIGRGGMATVYRAFDSNLERHVAVKLLHPHLAGHGESRARFQREAQAVARLKHDALLEIYDYSGKEGDDVFIVMELIEGTTLRRLLESQTDSPLLAEAVVLILRQVSDALAHAHAEGVVHRDVKPENILIGPQGSVKLSDFGIAHLAGMSQMTVTGQILGSPAYMSPEHVELVELDARADIFSFGIVCYEAAVGRQPFVGKNPHAVLKAVVEGQYQDPLTANPAVGHPLANIIRKCLRTDPTKRYQTFEEVNRDLDALLEAMGITTPKSDLARFFTNDSWVSEKLPEIIESTLALGVRAQKKRRRREAMDHFNRVLALRPGDEKALAAVAGMNRSETIKRVFERIAVGATILLVISAVIWGISRQGGRSVDASPKESNPAIADSGDRPLKKTIINTAPPQNTTPMAVILPDERDSSTKDTETEKTDKPPQNTPPKRNVVRNKPAEEKTVQYREVLFTPQPLSVTVVIDGRERFPFGPAHRSKRLLVGTHVIEFVPNDPKRFKPQRWEVDIPDGEGAYRFRGRLQWQPARIMVKSDVLAEVAVPGRVTDRSGRIFGVEVKKGPSEKVSILVSREGYIPQTKQVTITAGELITLEVNLKKATESP